MIKSKFNSLYIGLISGLLLPLITMLCFYLFNKGDQNLSMFMHVTFEYAILAKLISLAAIPDALLFYAFIWTEKYKSANGVIFSLFIICLMVIIIKFFL